MIAKCFILPLMQQTISPLNTIKYYHCIQKLFQCSAQIVTATFGLELSNWYLPINPVKSNRQKLASFL